MRVVSKMRAAKAGIWDAPGVVARLEEAGRTLLALPDRGYSPRLAQVRLDVIHDAMDAYGWTAARIRLPPPSPNAISRMDEAFSWLGFIPQSRFVLRSIVAARALVHPISERHLFSWRKLGERLRADHKAIQRWHAEGVRLILAGLSAPE